MLLVSPSPDTRHESLYWSHTAVMQTVTVTAGGTANTKGTWTAIGAATGFDYHHLQLSIQFASGHNSDGLVDIGIGTSAASVTTIIGDLRCSCLRGAFMFPAHYALPIHVPKGSVLYMRVQASTGSHQVMFSLSGASNGLFGRPGFKDMVSLFTVPGSSSRGTAVDPGGTANTIGSWTQLHAGVDRRVRGIVMFVGLNNVTARTGAQTALIDIGIGASGQEYAIAQNLMVCHEGTADCWLPQTFGPMPCDIPPNTRISARMRASLNTANERTADIAVWGFT
jgi:hypothetical protein